MMKPRPKKWWWVAGGVAASTLVWINRRLFTVNDVTAGGSRAYPDLKPATYSFPAQQIFAFAEATARDMARWRITNVDRLSHELQAEARLPVGGLIDDITIRVNPVAGSAACDVVVRSRSRIGTGDLGENARRIRGFYRALDDRVHTVATVGQAKSASFES